MDSSPEAQLNPAEVWLCLRGQLLVTQAQTAEHIRIVTRPLGEPSEAGSQLGTDVSKGL